MFLHTFAEKAYNGIIPIDHTAQLPVDSYEYNAVTNDDWPEYDYYQHLPVNASVAKLSSFELSDRHMECVYAHFDLDKTVGGRAELSTDDIRPSPIQAEYLLYVQEFWENFYDGSGQYPQSRPRLIESEIIERLAFQKNPSDRVLSDDHVIGKFISVMMLDLGHIMQPFFAPHLHLTKAMIRKSIFKS